MRSVMIAIAGALALAACQPEPSGPEVRALAEGEKRIDGMVISVEDGGYPLFNLTIDPAEADPLTLTLNDADADLGGASPSEFAGKESVVYYRTVTENSLMDLRQGEQSLMPEAVAGDQASTVTGVLSGAEAPSGGDLPDVITVTDASGAATEFPYFITPEIVAANGQEVTALYVPSDRDLVTYIRAAE